MLSRRHVCAAFACSALTAAVSMVAPQAEAQTPAALNLFIPAAPGGGWDGTGRTIEMAMRTDGIIKEFKFENVGGAGGAVGLPRFLARKGQGDTVMVAGMVMVGALIAANSPLKMADATPLARLTDEYEVVVVPAGSPHKTMADLIASFKAEPGKVSWAGGSAGGTDHILAGMIARAVGVDPKRVTYVAYAGGGPALAALLGNQVTAGVSGYSEFAEQIKAGKLRMLGVSAPARLPGIDVPTLKEQGIDVVLGNWRGVFGAPGISADQQKALIGLIDKMIAGPTWKAEVEQEGLDAVVSGGGGFRQVHRGGDDADCRDPGRARISRKSRARKEGGSSIVTSDAEAGDKRWGEAIIGLGTVVFAAIIAWQASQIASEGVGSSVGPNVIPWVVSGMLAAFGLALAGEALLWGRPAGADEGAEAHGPIDRRGAGWLVLGLLLNVGLIEYAGFIVASTLLFVCTARAFGSENVRAGRRHRVCAGAGRLCRVRPAARLQDRLGPDRAVHLSFALVTSAPGPASNRPGRRSERRCHVWRRQAFQAALA